jgi:hypothetical protein
VFSDNEQVREQGQFNLVHNVTGKKAKFALEQAMKAQRKSTGIALLFL